jgi:ribosomal protein L7/L12/DNA-binding beta-propeller fold protein YncE/DNA-directed RNA polymerase subunit RPC12/RpoP
MSQTFQCPNCGAPLDYDGGLAPVIRCPYCKSTVVVPEELHTARSDKSTFASTAGAALDDLLHPEQIARLREIGNLVRQGQKIEAIKLYREVFGTGLKEAKDAIDQLAAGKAIAITSTSLQTSQDSVFPAQNPQVEAEIRQLLQDGSKIAAIKRYREIFNCGLAEAKAAVEFFEKNGHLPMPSSPIWHTIVSNAPDASEKSRSLAEVISLVQSGQEEAAVAKFQQAFNISPDAARQAVQTFNPSTSITISPPTTIGTSGLDASSKRALKTAAGVTGGLSCLWVLLIAAFFILTVFVPVFLALTSSGGPLEGVWARYNPVAFARVVESFGGEGSGPGLFDDPRLITADPAGAVFVADYSDGRVQKFDAAGKFQFLWNIGDNSYLNGLGADRSGNLYILNRGQIWKYDGSNGKLLGQLAGDAERRFDALAATLDGGLVAAADSEDVLRFNADGQIVFSLADSGAALSGKPESIADIAVDGVGNIYLIGDDTSTIYKYAPNGQLLARFGSEGDSPGQFKVPGSIAVDGQGRIYVSDFKGIQVFATDGRYLGQFDVQGFAHGMDFTDQGELWVVTNKPQATKFTIVK